MHHPLSTLKIELFVFVSWLIWQFVFLMMDLQEEVLDLIVSLKFVGDFEEYWISIALDPNVSGR